MKPSFAIQSAVAKAIELWLHLNGETAYQAYLAHRLAHHAEDEPALSRKAFFAAETRRKWNGIKRCC